VETADEFIYKVIVMKEGEHLFNKGGYNGKDRELLNNSHQFGWSNVDAIGRLNSRKYNGLFITIFWQDGTIDYRFWHASLNTNLYIITDDELMIKDIIE
jgi:hypothetical protein